MANFERYEKGRKNEGMYLRYANAVGDTWKRSFSVSLPVKDHRVLVRGNENSAIRKVDHDGKVVSIESITKELARDLNSIVSWREREREREKVKEGMSIQ